MLTEFDRRMKEQETQGDKQENKADNNLSDAVFNFTPADSGIEMMDANMPEMAENPKQEETPESIITNEPQMVEEISTKLAHLPAHPYGEGQALQDYIRDQDW